MGAFINSLFILKKSYNSKKIIDQTLEFLAKRNYEISMDHCIHYNDWGEEELDPLCDFEEVETAIISIAKWPAAGGFVFYINNQLRISIFYNGLTDFQIDTISISISSRLHTNYNNGEYEQLVSDFHQFINSSRTISKFELFDGNFTWEEEVERVRNDIFEGNYDLDLRYAKYI